MDVSELCRNYALSKEADRRVVFGVYSYEEHVLTLGIFSLVKPEVEFSTTLADDNWTGTNVSMVHYFGRDLSFYASHGITQDDCRDFFKATARLQAMLREEGAKKVLRALKEIPNLVAPASEIHKEFYNSSTHALEAVLEWMSSMGVEHTKETFTRAVISRLPRNKRKELGL